jgi:hypothetical protein
MNISKLLYDHKNNAMFCAPNSLYININSAIISHFNVNDQEIITLDDIARNVGFSNNLGSLITSGNLSRLSNRVNKIIQTKKLNVPKLTLKLIDRGDFFNKLKTNNSENLIFYNLLTFHTIL